MQAASEEPCASRGNGPIIAAMPLYNEEETVGSVVLQASCMLMARWPRAQTMRRDIVCCSCAVGVPL